MELWDIFDIYRNSKMYTVDRSTPLKSEEYHLVVHTCIFNARNELLLQKRKYDKDNWPNMWDFSSGGAAISGEESYQAAQRELKEELSLTIPMKNIRPFITVHFDKGFDDYYIIDIDDNKVREISISAKEIQKISWFSEDEVLRLIDLGEMDIYKSFISLLFDMRKKRGTHKN